MTCYRLFLFSTKMLQDLPISLALRQEQWEVFPHLTKTILDKMLTTLSCDNADRRDKSGRFICQLLRNNMALRQKFFKVVGVATHTGYIVVNRIPAYLTAQPQLFLDIMTRLKYSSVSSEQFYNCVYWYVDPKKPYQLNYVEDCQFLNGKFVDTTQVLFGLTFHENYMEKQKKKHEEILTGGRKYVRSVKIEEAKRKVARERLATERSPMVSTVASHQSSMSEELGTRTTRTYQLWIPKENQDTSSKMRLVSLSPRSIAYTLPDSITKSSFHQIPVQNDKQNSKLTDITKKQAQFNNLRTRFDSRLKMRNQNAQ